eukprot:6195037-Pleurochrysis_carterae.AAC.5
MELALIANELDMARTFRHVLISHAGFKTRHASKHRNNVDLGGSSMTCQTGAASDEQTVPRCPRRK